MSNLKIEIADIVELPNGQVIVITSVDYHEDKVTAKLFENLQDAIEWAKDACVRMNK